MKLYRQFNLLVSIFHYDSLIIVLTCFNFDEAWLEISSTENESKYHDVRLRSQGKDGDISKTFAFVFHHSI